MKINDMEIEIRKTFYNKSKVQEDGVTHIIDTETSYPVFQFGMAKNYFDIDGKPEVTKAIINDLRAIANELERLIEKEKEETER